MGNKVIENRNVTDPPNPSKLFEEDGTPSKDFNYHLGGMGYSNYNTFEIVSLKLLFAIYLAVKEIKTNTIPVDLVPADEKSKEPVKPEAGNKTKLPQGWV